MTDHDTQDVTTQDVTECRDCPMRDTGLYAEMCAATMFRGTRRTIPRAAQPPDWCPLRTRPVLVRLVAKESK